MNDRLELPDQGSVLDSLREVDQLAGESSEPDRHAVDLLKSQMREWICACGWNGQPHDRSGVFTSSKQPQPQQKPIVIHVAPQQSSEPQSTTSQSDADKEKEQGRARVARKRADGMRRAGIYR